MTWEHLERGSSPVDWCEGNYEVSANIAEFVNTVCDGEMGRVPHAARCWCLLECNLLYITHNSSATSCFCYCRRC